MKSWGQQKWDTQWLRLRRGTGLCQPIRTTWLSPGSRSTFSVMKITVMHMWMLSKLCPGWPWIWATSQWSCCCACALALPNIQLHNAGHAAAFWAVASRMTLGKLSRDVAPLNHSRCSWWPLIVPACAGSGHSQFHLSASGSPRPLQCSGTSMSTSSFDAFTDVMPLGPHPKP